MRIESPIADLISEKLRERAEKYHGKKIAEARALIVEDLQAEGLLVKEDKNYTHSVGVCYRCGTIIEPLPLAQFFIKVAPLTQVALKALDDKKITVYGAGHDKILRHWLENLRDWNISRQIVWGIRIPVWYSATENPDMTVTFLDAEKKPVTGTIGELSQTHSLEDIRRGLQSLRAPVRARYTISTTQPSSDSLQETDTFDTWFSSTQWPFATLKANQPTDFAKFWVMRMILMGLFVTGEVPFTTVYLHGLVRDQKGQKMSKSKGNVINPLEIIEKYGADALRMALVIRSSAGLDKSVAEQDFRAMRNFTNKIWNAARFITLITAEKESSEKHKAFQSHLQDLIRNITQQLNDFKIGLAAETVYTEFWHWFCDVCIEQAKTGEVSSLELNEGLIVFLKLLHPFMPFVTEAVWREISPNTEQLILSKWPELQ